MSNIPLAERMRPTALSDYIGQDHLVGPNGVIYKIVETGSLPSFILWGPPGVGKTTLASIIAKRQDRPFYALSAINAGVKDIRDAIEMAKSQKFFTRPNPILFIDEIHRFSKSQQDALLGAVEKGVITLIGATTENPSFEVISALLSRCQVYVLKPLLDADLIKMIDLALTHDEVLKTKTIKVIEYQALIAISGGDGRKLYNALELVVMQHFEQEIIEVTNEMVTQAIQQNLALYDKNGEQHFDIISAFIKSMRASDPNAAVYYLARMIEGGEDPMFIGRRMIIFASEDIGLANPNALLLANACVQSLSIVGMPEGRIILSQIVIYLACSIKSNASYVAINQALAHVRANPSISIPLHLRNAPTQLMKNMDYGKNYVYAHDQNKGDLGMECLPKELSGHTFYHPKDNPLEQKNTQFLHAIWKGKYGY